MASRKFESAYDDPRKCDLINDVDDWFYNYFTLDNFDDTDAIIDNLTALIQVHKTGILSDCYTCLVIDYNWPTEFIDENYELIIDQLCEDAFWKLYKHYGIMIGG